MSADAGGGGAADGGSIPGGAVGGAAPAGAAAPTGAVDPNKEAQQLLKQGSLMQDDIQRLNKEREETVRELEEHKRFKARVNELYRKDNEPRANEYIAYMEEAKGGKLSDAEKAKYTNLFTRIEYKEDADTQWALYQLGLKNKQDSAAKAQEMVALQASKAAAEEELKKERTEKQQLATTLSKGASSMRAGYAAALAPASPAAPTTEAASVGASRAGGGLSAQDILVPHPSVVDMGFFKELGFQTEAGVTASADGGELRQLRTHVAAAREHRLLKDEAGDLQFPDSARYHYPHIFGWMVSPESGLTTRDLSNYTQFNSAREEYELKDASRGVVGAAASM